MLEADAVCMCRYFSSGWRRKGGRHAFMIHSGVHHIAALRLLVGAAKATDAVCMHARTLYDRPQSQDTALPPGVATGISATISWDTGLSSTVWFCMAADSVRLHACLTCNRKLQPACLMLQLTCARYNHCACQTRVVRFPVRRFNVGKGCMQLGTIRLHGTLWRMLSVRAPQCALSSVLARYGSCCGGPLRLMSYIRWPWRWPALVRAGRARIACCDRQG
jgi:hypothetical protein